AFSALTLGISLFLMARSYSSSPKGLKLWAFACCAIGIGWTLSASRGQIPDVFSIILSNTLALLSFVTFFHAIKELKEEAFDGRLFYAGIAAVISLLAYFNYIVPSIWARSILVSIFGAMIGFICAAKLLLNKNE